MADVQIAHTAWLTPEERQAIRILLDEAFDGDVTDDDYEHALGGMHALVWEGRELIGHGSVIMRRLLHGRRALRTGYVEGVAVRANRRRRGHGAALMTALERVIQEGCIYVLPVSAELMLDGDLACDWRGGDVW